MRSPECLDDATAAAFVDDSVLPEVRVRIEAHLAGCAQCRALVARLRGTAQWLGAMRREDDPSFAARVSQRLSTSRPPRHWPILVGALAASLLGGVVVWRVRSTEADAYTPRGETVPQRSLVGVETSAGGALLHGGERLDGRPLTFVVNNRLERSVSLALFAVDAAGEAHWFYPAWRSENEDPQSISVAASPPTQALPEAVSPEGVAPGALKVVALFTASPLRVREVEAALQDGGLERLEERLHPIAVHVLPLAAP